MLMRSVFIFTLCFCLVFFLFILSLKVNSALGLFLCSSPTVDIFLALQLLRCSYRFLATDQSTSVPLPNLSLP